jgi:hypothetical protein
LRAKIAVLNTLFSVLQNIADLSMQACAKPTTSRQPKPDAETKLAVFAKTYGR